MTFQPKIVKTTLILCLIFTLVTIVIISVTSVAAAPPAQEPIGTRKSTPPPAQLNDGRSPEFNPTWLISSPEKTILLKLDDGRPATSFSHEVAPSQLKVNELLDNGRD